MNSQSKEEKLGVVASHIRNISIEKYNAELSLISEEKLTIQYPETVISLRNKIDSCSNKILALQEQYKLIELE